MQTPRERIYVALDVPCAEAASALARDLCGTVGGFKIGMRLFYQEGPAVVKKLQTHGLPIFLDLKLHDIPQTVAQAARVLVGLGATMLTFHASGGLEMLQAARSAVDAEAKMLSVIPPKLLAVTVLTSLEQRNLKEEIGLSQDVESVAVKWAGLAHRAGFDGVVASPQEIQPLRTVYDKQLLIVTPGIRPQGDQKHDQKRTCSPAAAVQYGADYLVIGRPITKAESPSKAARAIVKEIPF